MKTGLILAILALAGASIALVTLGRANRELETRNLQLARQNAELRSELKLTAQRATQTGRDAVELDTELGATRTALTERQRRESALLSEIAALQRESDPAVHQQRIAELENQLAALLTRALSEPLPPAEPVAQPPAPSHEVVRLAPDGAFVILNYGSEHGGQPGQILSLARGTSEVAQVQISDARARLSVAQVLPASLKGKLQTGDIVLLTP